MEFGTPVYSRPFVLPRWRLYWLREEFGTPSGLEILLCEGGDVELGARTSKQISVFAFDLLTLTLSPLFVYCIYSYCHILYACVVPCINSYCSSYIICLACLCVPHLCLTTRASYSAATLIQRNQEELVQSPSPGIRLHSLVALIVVAIKFLII